MAAGLLLYLLWPFSSRDWGIEFDQQAIDNKKRYLEGLEVSRQTGSLNVPTLPYGEKPPNILLVTADDLGLMDVSLYGGRAVKAPAQRVYCTMISQLDHAVSEILDVLKELGIEDRTLIMFSSDNGGAVSSGTILSEPVIQTDFFSTAASAAGLVLPEDRIDDGVDLLPFVLDEDTGRPHEVLHWKTMYGSMIRKDRWKQSVYTIWRMIPEKRKTGLSKDQKLCVSSLQTSGTGRTCSWRSTGLSTEKRSYFRSDQSTPTRAPYLENAWSIASVFSRGTSADTSPKPISPPLGVAKSETTRSTYRSTSFGVPRGRSRCLSTSLRMHTYPLTASDSSSIPMADSCGFSSSKPASMRSGMIGRVKPSVCRWALAPPL